MNYLQCSLKNTICVDQGKSAEASLSTNPAILKPRAPVDEWQNWNYVPRQSCG
jgi:hypothetical protein